MAVVAAGMHAACMTGGEALRRGDVIRVRGFGDAGIGVHVETEGHQRAAFVFGGAGSVQIQIAPQAREAPGHAGHQTGIGALVEGPAALGRAEGRLGLAGAGRGAQGVGPQGEPETGFPQGTGRHRGGQVFAPGRFRMAVQMTAQGRQSRAGFPGLSSDLLRKTFHGHLL